MKNKLLKLTGFAALFLALAVTVTNVAAQTAPAASMSSESTASASAGAAVAPTVTPAIPAGYTVIPPDDSDRADDQIVQLENLTIQSMTSGKVVLPMTIYASRDVGGSCREFLDVSGSAGSKIYPCPLAPTVLYQISVQSDTILLLKNRSRASIGDFAVGDHINVFGFMDRGTSGVQALIVRDLDKPALGSRYVQLNDLTVVAAPDSSAAPATFQAARKGIEPCLDFSSVSAPSGVTAPCPLGVDLNTAVPAAAASGASLEFYRPFQQFYSVHVSSLTRILNASRQIMALGNIQAGDHVNIYGRYNPSNRTIEALIVRDLSVPRNSIGTASLVVTATAKNIVCITTPCGQIDGAKVELHTLVQGDIMTLVATQYTANGQAFFQNLKPGNYTAVVTAPGYAQAYQTITLNSGEAGRLGFLLSPEGDPASGRIRLISPNGGETLTIGSKASIRWQPEKEMLTTADIFIQGDPCIGTTDTKACLSVMPRAYAIARSAGQLNSDGTMTYRWIVPNTLDKILLGTGAYRIEVCYAGTSVCDWSDSYFKVAPAVNSRAPHISSIVPSAADFDATVAIHGSGFTADSKVYLNGLALYGGASVSADGTLITFAVPRYYPWSCPDGKMCAAVMQLIEEGQYPVYVANANGTSNSVEFTIVSEQAANQAK